MIRQEYKKKISATLKTSPDKIFLYWKGRVALYAILKAMGVKEGDEVILPAFTCVVVPNAIMYLGATPVYVDISEDTYNIDISKLNDSITKNTKVIICQNTFGLSSNIEEIVSIGRSKNIYTIEDCAHGFGGYYNKKPNGTICDAAFFSTQWNKPFSTGIGGFSVINKKEILKNVYELEQLKSKPTIPEQFILFLLFIFYKYFINDFTHNFFGNAYRFLSNRNLILGSNQGYEFTNLSVPKNYFKDISTIQAKFGLKELKKIDDINKIRFKNAKDYTSLLKSLNKNFVDEKFFNNHIFLKYPILVKDRNYFVKKAISEKINLGDWFFSPIYPIRGKLDKWFFNKNNFPVALNISKLIVNLPTDIIKNSKILKFIERNKSDII